MVQKQEKKFSRLLSLDIFRGLTIALMILVNSPGNQTPYTWLDHSPWNGCTLADLVFPFFIFIVGVSCVFSLSKVAFSLTSILDKSRFRSSVYPDSFGLRRHLCRLEVSHQEELRLRDSASALPQPERLGVESSCLSRTHVIIKILRRSFIIFLIGLFLSAFPNHFDLATLRVFGVLQRIAICYFFSAILFLTCKLRIQALIMAVLLIGYWVLMTLPGNNLSAEGNFAAYMDRLLLSPAQLYGKFYDPEGFLSTLPAIATALLGNLTGAWLLSDRNPFQKRNGMIFAGFLALAAGWFWGLWFPINKALWTSSYVLWTGGWALLVLALCYWLIEIKQWKKWSKPFEIFGVNAMAAYVLHVFFLKVQMMIRIPSPEGGSVNLKAWISDYLFNWASAQNAALLYALSYTFLWLLVLTILYRKKIFIKI